MNRVFSKEFSFTRNTNYTIIVSNPSAEMVEINFEERVLVLTVPEGSFLEAQLLISAGIVLAIPWIILSVRGRIGESRFKHKISR
ncbi:MAG: hypothetical protein QXN75_02255 [Thermoproteota archaeon]|nr:hypothetical protein [Candidatus Brockarchaeota archaeon]